VPAAGGGLDSGGRRRGDHAAPGDTNLDGVVDVLDASNFLAGGRFDTGQAATWSEGDFDDDGLVDILDAASFLATALFDAGVYVPLAARSVAAGARTRPALRRADGNPRAAAPPPPQVFELTMMVGSSAGKKPAPTGLPGTRPRQHPDGTAEGTGSCPHGAEHEQRPCHVRSPARRGEHRPRVRKPLGVSLPENDAAACQLSLRPTSSAANR